jgi:hypothetical protein
MGHIQKRKKFQKRNLAKWKSRIVIWEFSQSLSKAMFGWFEFAFLKNLKIVFEATYPDYKLEFPAPASETGVESYNTAQKFSDSEHGV